MRNVSFPNIEILPAVLLLLRLASNSLGFSSGNGYGRHFRCVIIACRYCGRAGFPIQIVFKEIMIQGVSVIKMESIETVLHLQ